MTAINRFSSRRQRLDHAFLRDRLSHATSYKRIAGYFRSSIFELVGEEIAAIPDVRILCNSDLDPQDLAVAKAVREAALKERWNETPAELASLLQRDRYRRLYALLSAGNVQVRVVRGSAAFSTARLASSRPLKAKVVFSVPSTKRAAPSRPTTKSCGKTLRRKAWPGSKRSSTPFGRTPIRCPTPSSPRSNGSPSALVKGEQAPADLREAWELLRNPLPPLGESTLLNDIRNGAGVGRTTFFTDKPFGSLPYFAQQDIRQTLAPGFFQHHNPILRHTVLRRRDTLENQGLLQRVAAEVHPNRSAPPSAYRGVPFRDGALLTNHPFRLAYDAAEAYAELLGHRTHAAGFIKSLLLQRICSSFASGRATARRLLGHTPFDDDDEESEQLARSTANLTPAEAGNLQVIVAELSRPKRANPKLDAVRYFLTENRVAGKTWLEHGCIIFSQYYDTARWIAAEWLQNYPLKLLRSMPVWAKRSLPRWPFFGSRSRPDQGCCQDTANPLGSRHRRCLRGAKLAGIGHADQHRLAVESFAP